MARWRVVLIVLALLGACVRTGVTTRVPEAAAVTIHWDRWQVPHVFAQTRAGVAYGLGWAQLRAYPEEILQLYAIARGEAARAWGERHRAADRLVRTLGVPAGARAALAARSPEQRAWLEGFAQGMNDFAAAHPERLSAAARSVLPVRPEDPLGHGQRILLAFVLLTGQRPLVMSLDGEVAAAGSNLCAIAPSRSASGHAMLLANPHLPWDPPAMRLFEAHLVGPDAPLYGATLIGFPTILIGFNDAIAWSHTVNVVDGADFFALVPRDGGYVYDGAVRRFDEHTESLEVRQPDGTLVAEPLRIRRSVHGPVLVLPDGREVAVRTGLDDAAGAWFDAWTAMGRARALGGFEGALRGLGLPMFTVGYADRDGHILYLSAGRVPRRDGPPERWREPVAGDTSSTTWTQLLPYDALPRVLDPPSGFVQNANGVPWFATLPVMLDPGAHRALMIPEAPLGLREIHALRRLSDDSAISFDGLRALQHSARLELADHVLDALLAAAATSGRASLREAAAVLAAWDRAALPDSRGAVLFEAWATRLLARAAQPFATPWRADAPLSTPHGLADPALALALLDEAAAAVLAQYGALDVAWGDARPLRAGVPGRGGPGDLGAFHVVEYAAGGDGAVRAVFGDTFVALVELRPEGPRAEVLLSYGNASPHAPFAADQLELLARGELRTPLLERDAIVAGAVSTVVRPAPR